MDLYTENIQNWKHRPAIYLSFLLVMAFFLWAGMSKIDEHISATGRVITAGKSRVVQHLEGGIVKDIFVKEGQTVEKGDILFNIINKKTYSDLKESQITLESYYITLPRLEAEQKGLANIKFSEKSKAIFPSLVMSQRNFFKARKREFQEKINGIKERSNQKQHKLEELKATIQHLNQELLITQEQLYIKRKLYKAGAISRSSYLTVKSTEKNFLTRISKVEKEIPILHAERAEILNLMAESKQKRRSSIVEEKNRLKTNINRLKERIISLQDKVNRTAVISPIRGIIDKLDVNTIGGVIKPGEKLTEITPVDEKLIIEGRVRTGSRGKIWLGLPVLIRVTAYDYTVYGSIHGNLTYISSDSYIDNRNAEYYKIKISLDMANIKKDMKIFPGMTVNLAIIKGKTSILKAILRPFLEIRDNALREI